MRNPTSLGAESGIMNNLENYVTMFAGDSEYIALRKLHEVVVTDEVAVNYVMYSLRLCLPLP